MLTTQKNEYRDIDYSKLNLVQRPLTPDETVRISAPFSDIDKVLAGKASLNVVGVTYADS